MCAAGSHRWIKLHEAGQGLVTARGSDPNLLRVVEGAVRLGTPLLLDDLPEGSLPLGLEGLLQPLQQANGKLSGRTPQGAVSGFGFSSAYHVCKRPHVICT